MAYKKTDEILNFSNNLDNDIITNINDFKNIIRDIDQEYILLRLNFIPDHKPVYFNYCIGAIYPYYGPTDFVFKKNGQFRFDESNIKSITIPSRDYIGTNILYNYNYYYGTVLDLEKIIKVSDYVDNIEILESDRKDNSKVLQTFSDIFEAKQKTDPNEFYIFRYRKTVYYNIVSFRKEEQKFIDIQIRKRIKSAA